MRISDWSSDVCSSDLPLLDRAQPRLRQMLRRPPGAEPGVVRRVEQEIGAVRAVDDLARKDDFITDLQPRLAKGAEVDGARPRPRPEVDIAGREARQADRRQ